MKNPPHRLAETLWSVTFVENSKPLEITEILLGFDFLQGCGYLTIYMVQARDHTDYLSSKTRSFADKLKSDNWKKSGHVMVKNSRNLYCEEYRLENNPRLKKQYLENILRLVVGSVSTAGNLPESVSVQHEYEVRVKIGESKEWIGEGDLILAGLLSAVPKQ